MLMIRTCTCHEIFHDEQFHISSLTEELQFHRISPPNLFNLFQSRPPGNSAWLSAQPALFDVRQKTALRCETFEPWNVKRAQRTTSANRAVQESGQISFSLSFPRSKACLEQYHWNPRSLARSWSSQVTYVWTMYELHWTVLRVGSHWNVTVPLTSARVRFSQLPGLGQLWNLFEFSSLCFVYDTEFLSQHGIDLFRPVNTQQFVFQLLHSLCFTTLYLQHDFVSTAVNSSCLEPCGFLLLDLWCFSWDLQSHKMFQCSLLSDLCALGPWGLGAWNGTGSELARGSLWA